MTLSLQQFLTGYLLPRLMAGQTVAPELLNHALNPTDFPISLEDVFHGILNPPIPVSPLSTDFAIPPLFRPPRSQSEVAFEGGGIPSGHSRSKGQTVFSAAGDQSPHSPSGQTTSEIEGLLDKIQTQISEKGGPKSATLCSLGVIYTKAGRFKDAQEAFDWAQRLSPHSRTFCELSILYRKWGRLQDSLNAINNAIRLDPHQGRYPCEKGITLRELGRLQDSLDAIDTAILLENHTQGRSFCEKGITLRELGRHQEALDAIDRAIRLDPHQGRLFCEKGITLRELGRHQEALDAIDHAIRLENHTQGRSLCEKGITLRELGRHQEALDAIDRAIRLDPHQGRYFCEKGITLGELGRHQEALEQLKSAVKINEGQGILYAPAYIYMALSYWDMNKPKDAVLALQVIVKRFQEIPEDLLRHPGGYCVYVLQAYFLMNDQKWQESQNALQKAIHLGAPEDLLDGLRQKISEAISDKNRQNQNRVLQLMSETRKDLEAILRGLSVRTVRRRED